MKGLMADLGVKTEVNPDLALQAPVHPGTPRPELCDRLREFPDQVRELLGWVRCSAAKRLRTGAAHKNADLEIGQKYSKNHQKTKGTQGV